MNNNNVILVAHHRKSCIIDDGIYMPIHVGKEISTVDLGIVGDNTGDNISIKNPIYCEMTALYWAWKNLKADYIGLCHYRRYFTFDKNLSFSKFKEWCRYYLIKSFGNFIYPGASYMISNWIGTENPALLKTKALDFSKELTKVLDKKGLDAIIPYPYYMSSQNVEQHFQTYGGGIHIKILDEIISNLQPNFLSYFRKSIHGNRLYAANMFVLRRDIFDNYCNLVFSVLDEHERRCVDDKWCYKPMEEKCFSRLSGYLAEILTNAFVLKLQSEKRKIVYSNIIFCNSI